MAHRLSAYDQTAEYFARRHITVMGVTYPMGEKVPRDGISEALYRRMYETRRLVDAGQSSPPAPAAPAVLAAPMAETELPEHLSRSEGAYEPGNKGWFTVYFGGKRVRSVRGEDAARQLLAELRGEVGIPAPLPESVAASSTGPVPPQSEPETITLAATSPLPCEGEGEGEVSNMHDTELGDTEAAHGAARLESEAA